jgi:predicted secreted protein
VLIIGEIEMAWIDNLNELSPVVKEFTIKLESNPTTGYTWQPVFDEHAIKLISSGFSPINKQMEPQE